MGVIIQCSKCPKCNYYLNPDYVCRFDKVRRQCSIRGKSASGLQVEDKKCLHYIILYEYMAQLIDGGTKKLHALLEIAGFDLKRPVLQINHEDDKEVEFVQQQDWEDKDFE